jgi:hypothetical protein
VLDEVEEGRLAPVQVVEDDYDRSLRSVLLEQLAKGPGDLLRRAGDGVGSENRGERAARFAGRHELLDDLRHGPVADPLAVGETVAADDGCVHAGEELLGQP